MASIKPEQGSAKKYVDPLSSLSLPSPSTEDSITPKEPVEDLWRLNRGNGRCAAVELG